MSAGSAKTNAGLDLRISPPLIEVCAAARWICQEYALRGHVFPDWVNVYLKFECTPPLQPVKENRKSRKKRPLPRKVWSIFDASTFQSIFK
jgi:hypothetical protein